MDKIGKFNLSGKFYYLQEGISLILVKKYFKKAMAGQEGEWDLLIYEGMKEGDSFSGKWAYEGFEKSEQYSGKWLMTHN